MEIVGQLLEIVKYTLPALIVFITAYLLLTKYMQRSAAEKAIELKMQRDKEVLHLRLQAYERLALFLERISPANVITRVRTPHMLANELQYEMVKNIREEFEHNLSQQIYVSHDCWNLIVGAKEEILKTINLIGNQMPPEASAGMLINTLLSGISNANVPLPSEQALHYLKAECQQLF